MKKMIVLLFAMFVMAQGQSVPVEGDIIQPGDGYTVRKSDSSSLGTMRTSRKKVVDSGWTDVTKWTDNKGLKLFGNVNDSGMIWINPRWSPDTNYYIPIFIYKGQDCGWFFRRINWTLTDVDSFIAIPRQN